MNHFKPIDWKILSGYAAIALGVCANALFPSLFDTITGAFGAPPGLGHKIFVVAGALTAMAALYKARQLSAQTTAAAAAPAAAITADVKVVPSDTKVVTQDTPEVPLNSPLPTSP